MLNSYISFEQSSKLNRKVYEPIHTSYENKVNGSVKQINSFCSNNQIVVQWSNRTIV